MSHKKQRAGLNSGSLQNESKKLLQCNKFYFLSFLAFFSNLFSFKVLVGSFFSFFRVSTPFAIAINFNGYLSISENFGESTHKNVFRSKLSNFVEKQLHLKSNSFKNCIHFLSSGSSVNKYLFQVLQIMTSILNPDLTENI